MATKLDVDSEKIKRFRTERAWSQEQLAEIAGIGTRSVQRIETSGKASLESVRALASAFGIDANDLLRRPSGEQQKKQPLPTFLVRLVNGRDLFTILAGAHATHLDHDELRTQEEVDLVGGFLQGMRDYLNLWQDIQPAERVQVTFDYNHQIEELARRGFWVFGSRQRKRVRFGDQTTGDWEVAIITIHRSDNPSIIRLGPEQETVATQLS
jgi:transcriptional regulator with XRE-family HTH domain